MDISQLYGSFYQEMLAYCTSLTKSKSSAEDLVQETYLRAMTHWDSLEDLSTGQCRAWLYKTARNLFIDQTRKLSREAPADDGQLDLASFEEDLSTAAVAQLVGRLPDSERPLFILRYFEGYNARELGDIFSLPPATVRSRLASAKSKLRRWVSD